MQRLARVMASGRFVSYQPTQIRVLDGVASRADEAGIAADLVVLRPRFDGLITYGARDGAERVADVAARQGFRAVIIGIWDINDRGEVANALAAAQRHPDLVAGISLGNERVFAGKTDFAALARMVASLQERAPQLAWTTTEPFHLYEQASAVPLLRVADVLLVNVHPVFQPWFATATAQDAAKFVVNVVADLSRIYCGPVLVKETGVPTAPLGLGYSPQRQAEFYRALQLLMPPRARRAFAYFSAFDAAWRVQDAHPSAGPQPQEGSWGLFEETRMPKKAALQIPLLPGQ